MSIHNPPDPDDSWEYFLETSRTRRDVSEAMLKNYRYAYEAFSNAIIDNNDVESVERPSDVDQRHCRRFVKYLKQEYSGDTPQTYASCISKFYGYMSNLEVFDANPMAIVLDETTFSSTDTYRRDLSVEDMRMFITTVRRPLTFCAIMFLVKTGVRIAELANLDMRDVHIDHPKIHQHFQEPRKELSSYPDAIYVDSVIREGEEYNGEVRRHGNKRERTTIIPIDEELKAALLYWLTVKPPTSSPANPLLVSTTQKYGQRLITTALSGYILRPIKEHGWHTSGEGRVDTNVSPHYFRHFFTTHCRNRMDQQTVKFIRGDVGGETMDTYTHNWGNRVREEYLKNIYKLLE